jgi:DNA-binding NarL/FixJ family response regulator
MTPNESTYPPGTPTGKRDVRVLVVDDVPAIRENLSFLLLMHPGISVVRHAEDGNAAIAAVECERPDVVIMDIRMPRRDGISASAEIRHRFPDVGIVMHSAYSDEALVTRAADLRVHGYFVKGEPVRDLVTKIRSAADAVAPLQAERCNADVVAA